MSELYIELAINFLNKSLEEWTIHNILHTPKGRNNKINPYNWTEEIVNNQRAYYTRWLRRVQNNHPFWKTSGYLIVNYVNLQLSRS